MRVIMGVLKSKHGVYYVRKKVPDKLAEAVSAVLGSSLPRVSWLKRSLRTKDLREANIKAKPALIEFDNILARAAAFVTQMPVRAALSEHEIERLAAYHYASLLDEDEEIRREVTGSEEVHRTIAAQLRGAGVKGTTLFATSERPAFGLSDREMIKLQETLDWVLPPAQRALARGDISFVREELDELLDAFHLNLDRSSPSYRRLGQAVLRQNVNALQAMARRQRGEVVETPRVAEPASNNSTCAGDVLSAALEGWQKAKQPSKTTDSEFAHAVRRFIELHGDLAIPSSTGTTCASSGKLYSRCLCAGPVPCEPQTYRS